jgi:hypothetical protein
MYITRLLFEGALGIRDENVKEIAIVGSQWACLCEPQSICFNGQTSTIFH